ncbi:MAG TPA: hypothetical protein PKV73_01290 [Agriterribacter sp.]|nr:hypothetical protein [Agriterribacter sp.]
MTPELTPQEIEQISREAERILKLAYVRHTTEVNPDDNWADWETCKKDGTVEMVLEAMTKQVTSALLKHKAEIQAYREALKYIADWDSFRDHPIGKKAVKTLNQFK